MTLRAKQMILKVGGNLVGIVLNPINMSQDENYYYYSGYYEYQSQRKGKPLSMSPIPPTRPKLKSNPSTDCLAFCGFDH